MARFFRVIPQDKSVGRDSVGCDAAQASNYEPARFRRDAENLQMPQKADANVSGSVGKTAPRKELAHDPGC